MSTKQTKLPNWFNGELYKEGKLVTNPFSGLSIELNNVELSMYDFIIGVQLAHEMEIVNDKMIKDFDKALDWFRKNNSEAYWILLIVICIFEVCFKMIPHDKKLKKKTDEYKSTN